MGQPVRKAADRPRWDAHHEGRQTLSSPVVSFVSKEVRDKFSGAILNVLRSSHPEALAP